MPSGAIVSEQGEGCQDVSFPMESWSSDELALDLVYRNLSLRNVRISTYDPLWTNSMVPWTAKLVVIPCSANLKSGGKKGGSVGLEVF